MPPENKWTLAIAINHAQSRIGIKTSSSVVAGLQDRQELDRSRKGSNNAGGYIRSSRFKWGRSKPKRALEESVNDENDPVCV
jgi:hypothetical protein